MIEIVESKQKELCDVCLTNTKLYALKYHRASLIHCVVLCKDCLKELKTALDNLEEEA